MGEFCTRFAFLALVCASFAGCQIIEEAIRGPREQPQIDVLPQYTDGISRIRPGVALIIQVGTSTSAPTTINTLVDQNGEVTMPLLLQAPVACDGLTLDALKQKLIKEYSAFYRQPQVTVTFAPYDGKGVSPWGTVTVLGEVGSPGQVNIPSTMELTVTKVLQMAGGVKPFADKTRIQVSRCDKDGRITKTYVDLKEIGQEGRVDKDMALRAGDVVWVPETWY